MARGGRGGKGGTEQRWKWREEGGGDGAARREEGDEEQAAARTVGTGFEIDPLQHRGGLAFVTGDSRGARLLRQAEHRLSAPRLRRQV